jgi:hypothetical protein
MDTAEGGQEMTTNTTTEHARIVYAKPSLHADVVQQLHQFAFKMTAELERRITLSEAVRILLARNSESRNREDNE